MEHLRKLVCPELQLAALLGRPTLTSRQIVQASALITLIDFNRFKELLDQHQIWVCVHSNIQNHFATLFPESFVAYLSRQHEKKVTRSRRQFIKYGQLLHAFKTADIPVRTLKGIPLAKKLYGDIAKRYSRDIDLLIPGDHASLNHEILTQLGYRCDAYDRLEQHQISLYFKAHKDLTYQDATETVLEIHLRLCPYPNVLSRYYSDHLVSTRTEDSLSKTELAYLCWHASNTLYHRLKWLLDIALYIERLQSHDKACCESLIGVAKRFDLLRALAISWKLANTLFGTELPAAINQFYNQDRISQLSAKRALRALNNPSYARSLHFKIEAYFGTVLLPQYWLHRWRALIQALNPNYGDILMLSAIPAKLSFLHKLLRPLTFCLRHARPERYLPHELSERE